MRHKLRTTTILTAILLGTMGVKAQTANWTLQEAVQYALDHNITIQQNELNRRLEQLTLQQAQLSQLPSVNLSTGYGRSFGRSIDPTSNQFVNGSYDFMSLSGSADVLLFGWFQKRNRIEQGKYAVQAATKELEQLQNDVSLNVANGYLRLLLAMEQVKINEKQVALSREQLAQTESFAQAGSVPELNVAQLQAQLASDSANLISAITEQNAAVLDIKALLNLDFSMPFNVSLPEIDEVEGMMQNVYMEPEDIYATASRTLPTIYSSNLRLKAARKGYAAAKGGLFPQLALSMQAGTNYSTLNKDYNVTGADVVQSPGTFAYDSASRAAYQVFQTTPVFTTNTIPLGKQLDNNFRQTVSVGLNIPLFNGWQAQTTMRQAKTNMLIQEKSVEAAELKLRQDVYKAHNDVRNAMQKYYAMQKAAQAARRAYDYAKQRNELGLTNTVEYLVIQNNWYRAEGNLASSKYDLIFKIKVIDYFLGNEIKM